MNGGESIAVLSRSAKTFWTVRRHLDSALFGPQKRTTRVVRFVFKTNQKKNQRRDKKCRSTELDMTCKNESVNLVVRDLHFVIGCMLGDGHCSYHKIVNSEPEASPAKISCF